MCAWASGLCCTLCAGWSALLIFFFFSYVAAWEFKGIENNPVMHKEELKFEEVKLATRSYK